MQELEVQLNQLKKEGCKKIYSEKHAAARFDRSELKKVLEILEKGDTLVVTKLDRLARNTGEGIAIIDDLFKRYVKVHRVVREHDNGEIFLANDCSLCSCRI